MINQKHLSAFLTFFSLCLLSFGAFANQQKPNFLVILADDQGYGDLAIHGNKDLNTPSLDTLARQSVRLNEFHAQPVYSPTRASLMTGRQFLETGVWGVHGGRDYLHPEQTTIGQVLQNAGYYTAMLGKWHLGKTRPYLPYERGFDESWVITEQLYQHKNPVIDFNGVKLQPQGWTGDYLTDQAIQLMATQRDKPFFIYLAYDQIHEPYYAPEKLVKKYRGMGLSETLATLYGMNEQLDSNVGRIINFLDRTGLSEQTIVIYMGDNGPIGNPVNLPHLSPEEMAQRNPLNLRGNKANIFENGTRAPGFIRWTGKFQPALDNTPVNIEDIFPTIIDYAGASIPQALKAKLDGDGLRPILEGKTAHLLDSRYLYYGNHDVNWAPDRPLYTPLTNKAAIDVEKEVLGVRKGRYKLVQGYGNRALYDLQTDPGERRDIKKQKPEVFQELDAALKAWYAQVLAEPNSLWRPVFKPGYKGETRTYVYAAALDTVTGAVKPGGMASSG